MVFEIDQCSSTWWNEVLKKVKKAVVFIDNATAECFHWTGNIVDFYKAGAECVKEFSPFENASKLYKKAVFITSAISNNIEVLKIIIESSSFEYCVLITTAHPFVLFRDRYNNESLENEMQAFVSLEQEMLNWMGNKEFTVEIFYFPLFIAPLTKNFFVTPHFDDMFPPLNNSISNDFSNSSFHSLDKNMQTSIRHLVSLLHSLLGLMGLRDEIYSLGDFSATVASMLENFPAATNRRKNAANSATVIFVDRTLDLSSALSHNNESILDCIKLILPNFPGHTIDVAVDMSSLCKANVNNVTENVQLAPGCLAQPNVEDAREIIEQLINSNQKNVLSQVYQNLSKVKDIVPHRSPPRITLQTIEKHINLLQANCYMDDEACAALQQAQCIVQTLKSPLMPLIQLKMSLEQIIIQNLAASKNSTSILLQLCQIIKSRESRGLNLEDILCLLFYVYCLAGTDITFLESQENELLESLIPALNVWADESTMDTKEFAKKILIKLKQAAKFRKDLIKYKSVVHSSDKSQPAEFKGILQQLMEELINPNKPEIVDLASKSVGITELLKSSLSLLMNKSKKKLHPADNNKIIIFVLGGIKSHEVNLIQKMIKKSGNSNILIGSTKLITPVDVINIILELKQKN